VKVGRGIVLCKDGAIRDYVDAARTQFGPPAQVDARILLLLLLTLGLVLFVVTVATTWRLTWNTKEEDVLLSFLLSL